MTNRSVTQHSSLVTRHSSLPLNFRIVFHQFGLLLAVLGALMLLLSGGGFGALTWLHEDYDTHARDGLLLAASMGLVVGGLSWALTRKGSPYLGRREALLLVSLSWLLGAALAALPLMHWARTSPLVPDDHPYRSFWACYFEAMSGLTTTGATVVGDVESLPPSLLLWRALLHWVGGIGIVVLFVAVLPSLGVVGKRLFRSETTGPSKGGTGGRPQIRDTARMLWLIYCSITFLEIAALALAGMPLFDSVCHSFATVATGGFGTKNASIAYYNSVSIDLIITIFMFLCGANFSLFDRLLHGQWRQVLRDPELRMYFLLMAGGAVVIAVSLLLSAQPIRLVGGGVHELTTGNALRDAAFAATSVQTTTGFGTADYDLWPFAARAVLLLLMFVGGCAGSTGSGFKVIRFWIVCKVLHREFEKVFRPQIVRPVRIGGAALDEDLKLATLTYVLAYIMIWALGSVAIMMFEQVGSAPGGEAAQTITYTTAATASLATLSNVGPGLALVGPSGNYGFFSTPSLMIMSVLMALGRLEIFAIIVLVMPRFWRGTS